MKRATRLALVGAWAVAALGVYVLAADGDAGTIYITAPVERGDVATTITATGTLDAVVTVKVGSQLSGQIAELLVDFNDAVKKDQPLAKLDPQSFEAQVREAEAALEVAEAAALIQEAAVERTRADLASTRANRTVVEAQVEQTRVQRDQAGRELTRKRALSDRGTVASSDVEAAEAGAESAAAALRGAEAEREVRDAAILAAEAGLRMAEADLRNARAMVKQRRAALQQAEVDLERTVIRSPIDGVVIGRDVDRGQTVAASLEAPTLFTIAQDLRRMEVHARIDEADIGRIRPGQHAAFAVDAFPNRTFAGTVVQIRKAPQVVQNVVTYTVVVSTENPDLLLLPGMTALVRIVVAEVKDVLKVPNAALRFRPAEGAAATAAAPASAATLGGVTEGVPAVVWVPSEDGGGAPSPVAIGTGSGDATATEVVAGPLGEGQPVIVGAATADDDGLSLFGIRLGL